MARGERHVARDCSREEGRIKGEIWVGNQVSVDRGGVVGVQWQYTMSNPARRSRQGDRHRGTRIQFWVPQPAHEVEHWRAAAKARGVTLSVWLRQAAEEKVQREITVKEYSTVDLVPQHERGTG